MSREDLAHFHLQSSGGFSVHSDKRPRATSRSLPSKVMRRCSVRAHCLRPGPDGLTSECEIMELTLLSKLLEEAGLRETSPPLRCCEHPNAASHKRRARSVRSTECVGRDWVGVLQVHDVPQAFSFIGVINLEHRAEGHRPHTPTNERSNNKSLTLCTKFEQEVHQETQNMSLSPDSSHQHVK